MTRTSRLLTHEADCSGLRWLWHTLSGYHVWLAEWDLAESRFLVECSLRRLELIRARWRQLADLLVLSGREAHNGTDGAQPMNRSSRLTKEECRELVQIGRAITAGLSCSAARDDGLPCRTCRLDAVRWMTRYLRIHDYSIAAPDETTWSPQT